MADFNIKVPTKSFEPIEIRLANPAVSAINDMKTKFGKIVDEVSTNSNIPTQLLYAFMTVLSNGKNNSVWVSSDDHARSGLFSLSNKVGKEILARERLTGRMNDAELAFLRGAGDSNLNTYLSDDKPDGSPSPERWYKHAAAGINRISRTSQVLPIDWTNPKIAIQTGAMWIGQVWDKIAEQSNDPLDKVIITITMPYGSQIQSGTNRFYIDKNTGGFLSGSKIVQHRPYNTDYTATSKEKIGDKLFDKPKVWIPGDGLEDKGWESGHFMGSNDRITSGSAQIINPRGGSANWAMKLIMAKDGLLDKLTT